VEDIDLSRDQWGTSSLATSARYLNTSGSRLFLTVAWVFTEISVRCRGAVGAGGLNDGRESDGE
jgi:hypothetical protein